jgi:PAS domain S-box-containing protein
MDPAPLPGLFAHSVGGARDQAPVVVAESDPALREVTAHALRAGGFPVSLATDAEETLAAALDAEAVILGLQAPASPGLEVLTALRARPETAELVVILLGPSLSSPELCARGLAAGADACLAAPADPDVLVEQVSALLRLRWRGAPADPRQLKRVQETEERLRLAIASGAIGTWDADLVHDLLTWDATTRRLFGLAPDAPLQTRDFLSGVHPEDRPRVEAAMARALDPAGTGEYDVEFRTVGRQDGVEHWVRSNGQVLCEDQRPVRVIGTIQEVTSLKRAEAERAAVLAAEQRALAETDAERARLDRLLMQAPVGIAVYRGPEHIYELANPAFQRIVNRTGVVGQPLREVFPHLRDPVAEVFDRVYATGEPFFAPELRITFDRAGDGGADAGYYALNVEPIRDAEGQVTGLMELVVDVTEQVRARKRERGLLAQLTESEGRFRMLATSGAAVVWRANPRFEPFEVVGWGAFTGQDPEGWRDGHWRDAVLPADLPGLLAAYDDAIARRGPLQAEYRVRDPRSGYRWAQVNGVPQLDPDGAVREWIGTVRDITDARRNENALRLLAAASGTLSTTLDYHRVLDDVAQLAVPRFADWVLVDLIDRGGALQRVAVAHADPARAELAARLREFPCDAKPEPPPGRALAAGQSQLLSEVPLGRVDDVAGARGPVEAMKEVGPRSVLAVPLLARGRRMGSMTFISTDESGRRYVEADRALAEELGRRAALALDSAQLFDEASTERRRAEEANRAKDEFLAVVSHELRTPLTAILGYSSMLRAGNLREAARARAVEVIERNARTQAQLIEDILDISRVVSGKLHLNIEATDLRQVVLNALDAVRPAADARGIALVTHFEPGLPALSGDPERLQQVVWNLLSNAIKFTPPGGRVSVGLSAVGGQSELVVSDTGRGIPAAFLPYVFDRFRQADASSTRSHGGLGLGLAIVKHLVELHGGTIEARSPGEGLGSTFIVRLPRAAPRAAPPPSARAPTEGFAGLACPPELEGLRVLVVDDQADARALLTTVLESCASQVTAVGSAAEALRALDDRPFDVLISDVGMPDMDGYALIRQVRQRPPERGGRIPAVALTAFARTDDRTRALLAGFSMHLAKPIEPDELVVVVASLLRRAP